ncbi:MAG: zinc ribbon domain-containing protein [Promethearchaeota archaeon]
MSFQKGSNVGVLIAVIMMLFGLAVSLSFLGFDSVLFSSDFPWIFIVFILLTFIPLLLVIVMIIRRTSTIASPSQYERYLSYGSSSQSPSQPNIGFNPNETRINSPSSFNTIYCTNCGSAIDSDSYYCKYCGTKIN